MEFLLNVIAERSVVRESLKGILWTIFFHRLFGPVTPITNEFFNISYPVAEDLPELDTLIDERIDQLIKRKFNNLLSKEDVVTNDIRMEARGQLIVQFLDRREEVKKKSGWFGQGRIESDTVSLWESWIINVTCLPFSKNETNPIKKNEIVAGKGTGNYNIDISIESFEVNLLKIIDLVDIHKDHIPPITSLNSSPFPYSINVEQTTSKEHHADDESWGNYIKKILD